MNVCYVSVCLESELSDAIVFTVKKCGFVKMERREKKAEKKKSLRFGAENEQNRKTGRQKEVKVDKTF